tara:strand:+ start:20 stop:601 length:582 start_codon:yes stop_codon:yes gene_type:complete
MPKPSRREDLIKTAIKLFNESGYHRTGVDKIMKEAKISKKTLYRYFRTKEELILACLQYYDSSFRNEFIKKVEKIASTPKEKLLAIFEVANDWFMQEHFFGCMFINAIGEYSETDNPIRDICKHFKTQVRRFIEQLCVEAGVKNAEDLAAQIALLFEGAIVTAQIAKQSDAAKVAQQAAQILIETHTQISHQQ